MQRNKTGILTAILLILALFSVPAEDRSVTLGGAAGWPSLSYFSGLAHGKGRLGQDALVLSSSIVQDSSPEDLYLSFDTPDIASETNRYTVVSNPLLFEGAARARRGNGAALCDTDGAGLVLRGKAGSFFATPGNPGSFTIEFWLLPAVTENGSVLLQWRSSRLSVTGALYQYIRSSLFRNHLEWTFSNIWTTTDGKPFDVTITGRKNLLPGVWSHHRLSWDSTTGALEYAVDGSTEAIQFITSTGHERGDVLPAIFGDAADLEIAGRYSGLLDEFRISRFPADIYSLDERHAVLDRYPAAGGRFESQPIDSGALDSTLKSISVVQSLPAHTGTAFFVRSGDSFYQWTASSPEWIPVDPDKPISGVKGRYFQVAGELYPDGKGASGPTVTSVSVQYKEASPPWPPSRVFTAEGSGSITVTWLASIDSDTAGYLVYYGDHPGEYLADGSPVDAGKNLSAVINGLSRGKLYFFSVAAYGASGPQYPGVLSGEVAARPR
jgi:hypothetical protein